MTLSTIITQLWNPLNKTKGDTSELYLWFGALAELEYKDIKKEGAIQFGIRKPLTPASIPIIGFDLDSIEPTRGVKPSYWFVGEGDGLKVHLDKVFYVSCVKIVAKIRDGKYTASAIIRKKRKIE